MDITRVRSWQWRYMDWHIPVPGDPAVGPGKRSEAGKEGLGASLQAFIDGLSIIAPKIN